MKKKSKKILTLICLFLTACFVVFFGMNSFAKYQISIKDILIGKYVDFCLSHDGDGQTAILQETESDHYNYESFITLSVINVKDGKTSKRAIQYDLRTPTVTEMNTKCSIDHSKSCIYDSWGIEYPLTTTSDYYDVEMVKDNGDSLSSSIEDQNYKNDRTTFEENVIKEVKVNLKIKRLKKSKSGKDVEPFKDKIETISIILTTSIPYIDIQVFEIKVTSSLVIMNPTIQDYFGFEDISVNVKTAKNYIYHQQETSYPVKVQFDLEGVVYFDYERFRLSVENNLMELNSANEYVKGYYLVKENGQIKSIILFIPPGSTLDCHFYVFQEAKIQTNVHFQFDIIVDYTSFLAGVSNGMVYQYQ